MPGLKAEQHVPALWGAGATAGSILALTLINAAGRRAGAWAAWAAAAARGLMLPWLKCYQVLKIAGAIKEVCSPFSGKAKVLSLRISER